MAGGEGTRLRPLSLGLPKPMTPLFDRPVMAHIIDLLRRCGIREIAVTLQYMPQAVMDYFGDGSEFGVRLAYFVEREPMGTAGGVKNCMSFLGDEDFLVISGDAVCDLDLEAAIAFHRSQPSAATLVLHPHPAPLEYGLVVTDDRGRITRFIEKPGWGQVVTDMVNTGIYLLTRQAMEHVPDGEPCDFGRDLFPRLLSEGAPLFGYCAEGYWCDMGDCRAYLDCVADALSGKVHLDLSAPQIAPGVWSASPIPPGVQIIPPCRIGRDVSLAPGCLIGPHTALGSGSTVGPRSMVQRSVLHGCAVGAGAALYGAILCKGAWAGDGCVLNEGAVLGENARAGEDAILAEGVKVWPNREAPAHGKLTSNLTTGGMRGPVAFGDGGVIRGGLGTEIGPELLLALGNLFAADGALGLGHSGGEGARMLAQAAGSGAAAAGARVYLHDAPSPAAAAWLGECYGLTSSLFVEQEGERVYLHLFGRSGLPLDRARQRKLESALLRGEQSRVPALRVGKWDNVSGVHAAYAADAARRARFSRAPLRHVEVSVPGRTPNDRAMAGALAELGCTVQEERRPGIPGFASEHGGFRLSGWDEAGKPLPPESLLTLITLIECENGGGRVAVPSGAPVAVETTAAGCRGAALRLGRDGPEAEERYQALPWLRDGVFAACRICARMGVTGESLQALAGKIPRFALRSREVPLRRSRGELMQVLAAAAGAEPAGDGVRLRQGQGWVYLSPLTRRPALRVVGEGPDLETAAELCDFFAQQVRKLDAAPEEK